jgi:exopolyphosphatase/guanosine-5'-triphosphate,3'-diphosphate pyrophosphatase
MPHQTDYASSLSDTQREFIRNWIATARVDRLHLIQVARLATRIFDQTAELHGEPPASRSLLEAAALLHDIGFEIDENRHHKRSRDLILERGLPEFTPARVQAVACVARYHRKAEPDEKHDEFASLDPALRETALRLSAIIRLADGLDRSHHNCVNDIEIRIDAKEVRLILTAAVSLGNELEGLDKKKGLFEKLFQRRVTAEARLLPTNHPAPGA